MSLEKVGSNKSFGGDQLQYTHDSAVLGCNMRFSIFLPPQAAEGNVRQLLLLLSDQGSDSFLVHLNPLLLLLDHLLVGSSNHVRIPAKFFARLINPSGDQIPERSK